jgi:hypothetical protein
MSHSPVSLDLDLRILAMPTAGALWMTLTAAMIRLLEFCAFYGSLDVYAQTRYLSDKIAAERYPGHMGRSLGMKFLFRICMNYSITLYHIRRKVLQIVFLQMRGVNANIGNYEFLHHTNIRRF